MRWFALKYQNELNNIGFAGLQIRGALYNESQLIPVQN